jgi:hypothetical protein
MVNVTEKECDIIHAQLKETITEMKVDINMIKKDVDWIKNKFMYSIIGMALLLALNPEVMSVFQIAMAFAGNK